MLFLFLVVIELSGLFLSQLNKQQDPKKKNRTPSTCIAFMDDDIKLVVGLAVKIKVLARNETLLKKDELSLRNVVRVVPEQEYFIINF